MKKLFFPKRIPEPKEMEQIEFHVFEKLSKDNYKRWIVPLVDHVLEISNLKEGIVLDVACGPGFLAKEFAQRSKKFEVHGIDTSSIAINLAKKNCKDFKNASFKRGSVYNLHFPDRFFDIVVCKDSLHHFDDPKKAIKEMLRVTKKGGVVYIQDLRRDLPKHLLEKTIPLDSTLKKLQFYSARASFTKEEIRRIIDKLNIQSFNVYTRKITPFLGKKYKSRGVDLSKLREGFQARYVAILRSN